MNILLTGCAGQLGQELRSRLKPLGKLYCTDYRVAADDHQAFALDLTDRGALSRILDKLQPDVIVNAAAWTAVDEAENQPRLATCVNVDVPHLLAEWVAAKNGLILHYSTDYVFDGSRTEPWREENQTRPLSVYGESKRDGENAIVHSGCRHIILRTSWVYSSHSKNFVRTMLQLASSRETLQVVDDQRGCPTLADNVADVSTEIIRQLLQETGTDLSGIYHYTDDRSLAWCEFAEEIFSRAMARGLIDKRPEVQPVASSVLQTPAERPLYSVLNCEKIARVFGIRQRSFDQALDHCMREISL